MKESEKIKNEINQIETRLGELVEMRSKMQGVVDKLQNGFIDKRNTLEDVQAEQAKLDTLNNSIKTLESKKNEAEERLSTAFRSEDQVNMQLRAQTVLKEAEEARNSYLKIRQNFSDSVAKLANELLESMTLFRTKQREYSRIIDDNAAMENPLELGLKTESSSDRQMRESLPYPPMEYAEVVDTAVNILASRLNREERKSRAAH